MQNVAAMPLAPAPVQDQGLSQAQEGEWEVTARFGLRLRVSWRWRDDGERAEIAVVQLAGPADATMPQARTATLGFGRTEPSFVAWQFGPDVTAVVLRLELRSPAGDTATMLWASVPLSPSSFVDEAIARWEGVPEPPPPYPPYPPYPPFPPPEPPPPGPDTPDGPDHARVEALPGTADLFPVVWLRPLTRRERNDAPLRYMAPQDTSALQLYQAISGYRGDDAATQKRQAAATFLGTTDFIDPATLQAPDNLLAPMNARLLAVEGQQSRDALLAEAGEWFGEAVGTLLQSLAFANDEANAWQSVLALALAGTAANGATAAALVDMLRTVHYLRALVAGDPAVEAQDTRRLLLRATPALQDAVTAYPLSGASGAAPLGGRWSLLGVGEVEVARQQLWGYAAGELAEVVNLMPRERQERHERSVDDVRERESEQTLHHRGDEHYHDSDAASELGDTLREAMLTEGVVRNLSGVTPSYSNLNLLLTGTAADGGGRLGWDTDTVSRLVQRMSEHAAQRVADRVQRERQQVRREWRERRASRCIDNHDGTRLVGVYRWVDRILQVWLRPQGRRLVLAFEIDAPAQAWVAQVARQGPVPLVKPEPLPAFAAANGQGYTLVTPANYQAWGAQYGLSDLPAPPADATMISAQVGRAAAGDTSLLRVPEGYAVSGGIATLALADSAFSVVASIGGTDLPGNRPVAPAAVSVVVPAASSSTAVGNPTVTPVAPAPAWLQTTTFQSTDAIVGRTGAIPVTVLTSAPLFSLTVELTCQRLTLKGADAETVVDPLMTDWQMRVYNRLLQAWQDAMRAYDAALSARIAADSAGHTASLQRQALRDQCLDLLCTTSATPDPQVLAAMLEWPCMSWHYDPPPGGNSPAPGLPAPLTPWTEPASGRLFRRFLEAGRAWVLVPVREASQAALLYALQWQAAWPAPAVPQADAIAGVPVSQSTVPMLEEQRDDDSAPGADALPPARKPWTMRVPLPLIYLQQGDALPRFAKPDPSADGETP